MANSGVLLPDAEAWAREAWTHRGAPVRAAQRLTIESPQSSLDLAQRFRGFSSPVPDFHRVWYAAMDDSQSKNLILAPRESAKTSTALTYAEYRLIRDRQTRVGIVSKSEGMATAFLREMVRDFESNEALIRSVGRLKPEKPKVWNLNEILIEGADLGKDVSVFALGVGGQVTGRRADLLLLDDIETMETVLTAERRARTREWFAKELLPILSPGGKAVVVGTRKHQDDIYSWLMADGSGWWVLDNCTQAILSDGSSYWPERWTIGQLDERKADLDAVNIRAWASEYMNRIVPAETQMFNPEAWPRWTTLQEGLRFYQAWDLAISEKTTADFTVGVCVGIDSDKNVYILDCRRGHWSFDQTQREIVAFGEKWHPSTIGIEAVAYQVSAVQEANRRSMLPVRPVQTKGDKVTRAQLLEARAAVGKVYRPAALVPWWPDMASELAFFPSGSHDDCVDALVYALSAGAHIQRNI